jgi:hypothetical protein
MSLLLLHLTGGSAAGSAFIHTIHKQAQRPRDFSLRGFRIIVTQSQGISHHLKLNEFSHGGRFIFIYPDIFALNAAKACRKDPAEFPVRTSIAFGSCPDLMQIGFNERISRYCINGHDTLR